MIGDYFKSHKHAPETQVPINDGVCKRGCCWTPYGCGRQKSCDCHEIKPRIPDLEALIKKEDKRRKNND